MSPKPRSKISEYADALELDYEMAELSFLHFFKCAWNVLEPGKELRLNWHHELIAEHLDAVALGQTKRLLINIEPRALKSNITSVAFPVWRWLKQPSMRFIFGSYSDTLSTKHSVDRRSVIESGWYQGPKWYKNRWGGRFKLATDQNVKTAFANDKRGHMIASSMGAAPQGIGCNALIVDDPHNTKRAESDKLRDFDIRMFENAFAQRLDDPETGVIIIVMQRLHERDLSGHVLSQNLGYTHLKIPGEFRRPMIFHFPLSERVVECQEGTALHPDRKSMTRLEKQKRELGHHGYCAQILQEPEARGGGILKAEKHVRFWHHRKADPPKEYPTAEVCIIPSEMDKEVQSWDLTFKDKKKSDFVVGQVWGKVKANCYLKDQVNDRMSFTASKEALERMTLRYPDTKEKYVEDAANGPALQDDLKADVPGIILVSVNGMSKSERLYATEYLWDAGNVWLPHPEIAPWILDYLSNVLAFPRSGVPDDEVDATTQALIRLNGKPKIKTDINMDLGSLTRASPWS